MAVNRVLYNGQTVIDLTADTVSERTLAEGATAHDSSGNVITGTIYNIDAIALDYIDGTKEGYDRAMKVWFDFCIRNGRDDLTQLCDEWYALTRGDWTGWTEFWQPDISDVSYGTKRGDSADMACEPSTDSAAGQDDFAGLPLFACVDVNFEVDADTKDIVITAIDGITDNFERYDENIYVGSMMMSGYVLEKEDEETYSIGYSTGMDEECDKVNPIGASIRPDGTMRQWICISKYEAREREDGGMSCCSGVLPTAFKYYAAVLTMRNVNGTQYSGECAADLEFAQLMMIIKYGSMTLDGIMQGCCNYSYQRAAQAAEENVNRVLLTESDASALDVGSVMLIGNYTSSGTDRAYLYDISGQSGALITRKESVTADGAAYTAVYFDGIEPFSTGANGAATEGTTYVSTFGWPTGMTDGVLGSDGSPSSNTSGKYPFKIQGVELMCGGYGTVSDTILKYYTDDDGGWIEPYVCRDSSKQSGTAVTDDYEPLGLRLAQFAEGEAAAWTYVKRLGHAQGAFFPILDGGTSSSYTRDAYYKSTLQTNAARGWRVRGSVGNGAGSAGLSCAIAGNVLSYGSWTCRARLSCNGNRGEWTAQPDRGAAPLEETS